MSTEPKPSPDFCASCGFPLAGQRCEVCGGDRDTLTLDEGRRREVSPDLDDPDMAGLERAYVALREQDPSVFVGEVIAAEGGARLAATSHGPGWIAVVRGALVFISFDADAGEISIEAPVVRVPKAQRVPVLRLALELSGRELATSRFCLRDDVLLLRFTAGVTALTPLMIRRLLREVGQLASRSTELFGVGFDARPVISDTKRDTATFDVLGRPKQLNFVSSARRVGPPSSSRRSLESVGPMSARGETARPAPLHSRPPPARLTGSLRREDIEAAGLPPPEPDEPLPAILEPMFANAQPTGTPIPAIPPPAPTLPNAAPPPAASSAPAAPRPAMPSTPSTPRAAPPALSNGGPSLSRPAPPAPSPGGTVRPPPPPPPSVPGALRPPPLPAEATARVSEAASRKPSPSLPGAEPPPQRRPSLINMEAVPSGVAMRPQTMSDVELDAPSRRQSGMMRAVQPGDDTLAPADHLCAMLRQAKLLASMTLESRPGTMTWLVRSAAFRAIYDYRDVLPDAVAHFFRCTGLGKESAEPALLVIDRLIAARAAVPKEKPVVVEPFTSAALAKEQIGRYLAEIERAPAEPTFRHFLALGALTELLVRAKLPAATDQRLREIVTHGQREGTRGSAIELMMTSLQRIAAG